MNHEFHATYSLLEQRGHIQQAAIDFLTGNTDNSPKEWPELGQVRDLTARRRLLAQALLVAKDYAHVGRAREAGGLLKAVRDEKFEPYLQKQREFLAQLDLIPQLPDMTVLSTYSFALQFTFKLRKPYLSQDDAVWDIWDNPVKKEWVFGLPYVAPTGWKGALRAALRQKEGIPDNYKFIARLFGSARDETEDQDRGQRGRLMFYSTFFTKIGLEVINPHDRATGAGKQPIYFECVPAGAEGTFTLLYVPFDLISCGDVTGEVAEDLNLVAEGVKAMFTEYGFGAKTSSGFGVAMEDFAADGEWRINYEIVKQPTTAESTPSRVPDKPSDTPPSQCTPFMQDGEFPKYNKRELGARVKSRAMSKNQRKRYKRARRAYQKWQEHWRAYREAQAKWEEWEEPQPTRQPLPPVRITNFGGAEREHSLAGAAARLIAALNEEVV